MSGVPEPESVSAWPVIAVGSWRESYATLHMWAQIVGKLCLALTPLENHFWNVTFRVTARGLATPTLPVEELRAMNIMFDFEASELVFEVSDGSRETIALRPQTVADFYRAVRGVLSRLNVEARIWPMPVEIPDPVRFDRDTVHGSYDPAWGRALWRALVAMYPVFETFRCGFVGKCSPVHFFWGSFDLAVTRFSGRRAPQRPEADAFMREAYSHEVISHGFWPGSGPTGEPAFYAYAAPEPAGFKTAAIGPSAAKYDDTLGEFLLPYEAVRTAASPEKALRTFLDTTYESAARLAGWPRAELER